MPALEKLVSFLGRSTPVELGSAVLDDIGRCVAMTPARRLVFFNGHGGNSALVVMDETRVVGMFTERDVLRRVVGDEKNPATTKVGQVMTSKVVCCDPDSDLDEVATLMRTRRIRHVPVCNGDGRLLGMVSIGDVNAYNASNQETTIHFLNEYIYGRA